MTFSTPPAPPAADDAMTPVPLAQAPGGWTDGHMATARLARTPGIGMATYRKLVRKLGSAAAVTEDWARLMATVRQPRELASRDAIERERAALHASGGHMLVWGMEDYPAALAELPDAPLVLSVMGRATLLHTRQVAVVGNRSASAGGMRWTEELCRELAKAVTITSGLARGIDTAAHHGALAAGGGTVAVVAGGIDHVYPPENAGLRQRIIQEGCLVSEQLLGSAPTAQLFPRRNRIIAGLSVGVVVAEASRHSGSLITAECALGYGRDVWAVPGSPSDARASGPNYLLKQGAQLVEGAADILDSLPQAPRPYVAPAKTVSTQPELFGGTPSSDESEEDQDAAMTPRQAVWQLLGRVGVSHDELLRRCGLDYATCQSVLMELELDGLAVRDALGSWTRA